MWAKTWGDMSASLFSSSVAARVASETLPVCPNPQENVRPVHLCVRVDDLVEINHRNVMLDNAALQNHPLVRDSV